MKWGAWWYLAGVMFFWLLILVFLVQNVPSEVGFNFLWMKNLSLIKTLLWIVILGVGQGICLMIFVRLFFITMKTPELTKFDLDKPLN